MKHIAYRFRGRLPPAVDVEDLIQAGMIGLLEAARSGAAEGRANFAIFASSRIRRAMLDEVRKMEPRAPDKRPR